VREGKQESIYLAVAAANERRADEQRLVDYNARSIDLIRSNARRGMSRAAMRRIWSDRLINLVLGHEELK
jgi:predicted acetyltransferase